MLPFLSFLLLSLPCLFVLLSKENDSQDFLASTGQQVLSLDAFVSPIDYKNLSSFKSVNSELSFCSFLPSEVSYASDRHSLSVCVKMMFLVIWEICSGKFRGGGVGRDERGG